MLSTGSTSKRAVNRVESGDYWATDGRLTSILADERGQIERGVKHQLSAAGVGRKPGRIDLVDVDIVSINQVDLRRYRSNYLPLSISSWCIRFVIPPAPITATGQPSSIP